MRVASGGMKSRSRTVACSSSGGLVSGIAWSLVVDVVLLSAQLQVFWVDAAPVMTPVPYHLILSREHLECDKT